MENNEIKKNNEKDIRKKTSKEKKSSKQTLQRDIETLKIDNPESRTNEKGPLQRSKTLKKINKGPISPKEMDKDSISIFKNKYSKPILESQKQSEDIIINQHMPTITAFTLEPAQLKCPFCKREIISEVVESFNCCTCLLVFFAIIFCAIPLLICSGLFNSVNCNLCNADYNCGCGCCCDATHLCPKCKRIVGIYDSYPKICC